MKRFFFLLLLAALPVKAQTQVPVSIQNPSFAAAVPLNAAPEGPYNLGPVPSWTLTGFGGIWQPAKSYYPALPAGTSVLWLGGGSVTQDLGPITNSAYIFTVSVGRRSDGMTANYTMSLSIGATPFCSQTASNGTIPAGTFITQTLNSAGCPVPNPIPVGNLVVTLSSDGQQVDFGNVAITMVPSSAAAIMQLTVPGFGILQFYILNASQVSFCEPNDGTCTIQFQVCNTANPPVCSMLPFGTIQMVKTVTLPTPQTLTQTIIGAVNID
jgi:hypothetical protein